MRSNLVLIVLLSLFLGACASKRQASSGKRAGNRPAAQVPDRPGNSETRWDQPGNKPAPASPSRSLNTEEYIRLYSSLAVEEMERSGVPASITLAQGILESGNGNSRLARQANNHFGIKCGSSWKGRKTYKDDDRRNECFRAYPSIEASFRDHSEFLKRQRYAFLFNLDPDDYKGWARGLKKAGYATNPRYPQLLISLIERYELYYFDRPRRKKPEKILVNNEKTRSRSTASRQAETGEEAQPAANRPVTAQTPATAASGQTPANTTPAQATTTAGAPEVGTGARGQSTTAAGTNAEAQAAAVQAADIGETGQAAAGPADVINTSHYYYTVKQGDTLYAISKRFNITLDEVKNWNSLSSNAISVGQQLRVSR